MLTVCTRCSPSPTYKIALVVHGRFHGFDLARALISRGHQVIVFTNYPKWAARKFHLPDRNVRSFLLHGILSRGINRLRRWLPFLNCDGPLHSMFSRWAARHTARESWDLIHSFSGVAEEVLRHAPSPARQRWMVRASAHIRTQDQLLAGEAERAAVPVERPSQWMVRREEREYRLADRIVTLSSFARDSFLAHGFSAERVLLIPSGINLQAFRPSQETIAKRCRRIASGAPLQVLFVGTASLQKGIFDLVQVIEQTDPRHFSFRFVSNVTSDAAPFLKRVRHRVELCRRVPQSELPSWYAQADLFVFPTIQDGFPAVLAQANANALPVLTTPNCSAKEVIRDGATGWIVPIRQPQVLLNRLNWCHQHRKELAHMVEGIYREFHPRTWDDMAVDFERHLTASLRP